MVIQPKLSFQLAGQFSELLLVIMGVLLGVVLSWPAGAESGVWKLTAIALLLVLPVVLVAMRVRRRLR